jgi:hypothetical protein
LAGLCGALALVGCLDPAAMPPVGSTAANPVVDPTGDDAGTVDVPPPGGPTGDGSVGSAHDLGAAGDLHVSDVAVDGGTPTLPSCAGTILCDNFEAYAGKPGAPWMVSNAAPGSSLVVDTTKPYSGQKSVHVTSGGGGNGGDDMTMRTTMGLPAPGNHVFGRMMMFLKGPWPMTHIRVMGMPNPTPAPQGYVIDAHTSWSLEALVDNGGNGGNAPIVTDKWVCVEWEFNAPSGGAVTTHLWISGTEVLPAPVGFPHVDMLELWVGYTTALISPPTEMWVDDVALSTTRIGCE